MGTPQKLTAVSGAVVWSATYSSFGEATVEIDTVENPLRFAGQIFDSETGLHYNHHRYYDPIIGRYLRADPFGMEGGLNLYFYAFNNPIRYYDPYGLAPCDGDNRKTCEDDCAAKGSKVKSCTQTCWGLPGLQCCIVKCECEEANCDEIEKQAVGIAKNVERHAYDEHMHSKPCKNLRQVIKKAAENNCLSRQGVQYAIGVYNTLCATDWGDYDYDDDKKPDFPLF